MRVPTNASDSPNLRPAGSRVNRSHCPILLLALVACNAHAAELEWMSKLSHGSDAFRGCPFKCEEYEPQYDALTGGVTITAGTRKRWEIDLSHGFKWIDRGPREGATEFSVRYYPLRNRGISR